MSSHLYDFHFVIFHHVDAFFVGTDLFLVYFALQIVQNQLHVITAGLIGMWITTTEARIHFADVVLTLYGCKDLIMLKRRQRLWNRQNPLFPKTSMSWQLC